MWVLLYHTRGPGRFYLAKQRYQAHYNIRYFKTFMYTVHQLKIKANISSYELTCCVPCSADYERLGSRKVIGSAVRAPRGDESVHSPALIYMLSLVLRVPQDKIRQYFMTLVHMYSLSPYLCRCHYFCTDRNITAQLKEVIRKRESLKDNLRFVVGRIRRSFVFYG